MNALLAAVTAMAVIAGGMLTISGIRPHPTASPAPTTISRKAVPGSSTTPATA